MKRPTRTQVSVSSAAYDRMADAASEMGITVTSLVDLATADIARPESVSLVVSHALAHRIEQHAAKQGLPVETVLELAIGRLTRREP